MLVSRANEENLKGRRMSTSMFPEFANSCIKLLRRIFRRRAHLSRDATSSDHRRKIAASRKSAITFLTSPSILPNDFPSTTTTTESRRVIRRTAVNYAYEITRARVLSSTARVYDVPLRRSSHYSPIFQRRQALGNHQSGGNCRIS